MTGVFRTAAATILAVWCAVAAAAERWSGEISLPGMTLEFTVEFVASADGPHAATITIPMQGVAGLPLEGVVYDDERLAFSLGGAAQAHFECAREGADAARGVLKQHGQEFPVTMKRLAKDAPAPGPRRPQHPERPFPYDEVEATYTNAADGVTLAGTLTLPRGVGPFPAVVLITGSGPQDRDETIFGHKPFLVLSDRLTRAGVATLRADDRGVGGSGGSTSEATAELLVGDVRAAVALLASRPEIDATRIGLIGHSEGGMLAPRVATEDDRVAFIVLLAGTGVSGAEVLEEQAAALLRAAGAPDDVIERNRGAQREALRLVMEDASEEKILAAVRGLVVAQAPPGTPDETIDQVARQQVEMVSSPWFRSFLSYDPRTWLREVVVPVLALNGSLDLQVDADINLREIERALAKSRDVTVMKLEGLNHLFQTARRGTVDEYMTIEETFAPAALEIIEAWVVEKAVE